MEQFTKLASKLSELFELEKSDLDFGIHRIIKARQDKIQTFLSPDWHLCQGVALKEDFKAALSPEWASEVNT